MTEEQEATEYILGLTDQQLEMVDYEKMKWSCSVQGCNCYTNIRDFGISPVYRWRKQWINLEESILHCGKHTKIERLFPQKKFVYKDGPGINHIIKNS